MYTNTSESFNSLITKAGRTFRARILLGDTVLAGLSSVKTTSGSNNGDALTLGSTVSQMVEITMDTPDVSLAGQEFELQIGLKLDEDNYEYLPMGLFVPEKITNKQKKTSFTAYDRMMKLSGGYISDLTDETDTISVLNEISKKTGVPVDVTGLTAISMKKPVGYTYREVLMYISQMYGCFANANRAGTIELHFWEDAGYQLTADAGINGFTYREDTYTVECITCAIGQDEDGNTISISAGAGTKGITLSNPFMTQGILNAVYEKINGFSYVPVECPVILGDPRLDPWDLIEITDAEGNAYKTPIMTLTSDFDGGFSCTITCTASEESEQESDYKGPMEQFEERMLAKIAIVESLTAKKISADELEVKVATFGYLTAEEADIKYALVEELNAANADIGILKTQVATIEKAYINEARVEILIAEKGYITSLEVNELLADYATIKSLDATNANIKDLSAIAITTNNLSAKVAELGYATVESLDAATARIVTLETTTVKASELEAEVALLGYLKASEAEVAYATITQLNATNANVSSLTAKVGDISTLMFGSASGGSLTTEFSNSVIALIGDATISSAKIASLSASKITSGTVNTDKVTVQSEDGNLQIAGNTILVKDASRTRVQIGKDANGDYNIYIIDASGNVMFDATGIHSDAIKSPIIEDSMVTDDANISASKLDIDSLFEVINEDDSHTLKSSKIYLDENRQTLDVAFTSMTTKITTVESAADNALSKANANESNIETLTTTVSTQGTEISVIQGQIDSKIWTQDITDVTDSLGNRLTTQENNYNSLSSTVSGLKTTVASHADLIAEKADGSTVTELSAKVTEIESSLSGFKVAVSDTYATKTALATTDTKASNAATAAANAQSAADTAQETADSVKTELTTNYYTKTDTEAQLEVLNKAISAKVSTTEFSSYKTTVTNSIATAKSEAIATASADATNKADAALEEAKEYTDDEVDVITAEVTTVKNTVASHTTSLSSITSRVATNEAMISTLDGEITSLEGRMSAAELKITDSAIISTVSGTYVKKTDANNTYATQSALATTNSNVSIAQSTADNAQATADSKNATYKGAGSPNYIPEGELVPAFTNLVPTAISHTRGDDSVFNGTGYKNDSYRSSNNVVGALSGFVATGLIPYVKKEDGTYPTIYVQGGAWTSGYGCRLYFYKSDKVLTTASNLGATGSSGIFKDSLTKTDYASDYFSWTPTDVLNNTTMEIAYVAMSVSGTGENLIVTLDEPIEYEGVHESGNPDSPSVTWKANGTESKHEGDLYIDTETGYTYRWQLNAGVYEWARVKDGDIVTVEAKLELKVDSETLISEINASADIITLSGNRFIVNSDNLQIAEDGTITATNGIFKGTIQGSSGEFTEGFSVELDTGYGDGSTFALRIEEDESEGKSFFVGYTGSDAVGQAGLRVESGLAALEGYNLELYASRSMSFKSSMQIMLDAPEIYITDSVYGNGDFELISKINELNSNLLWYEPGDSVYINYWGAGVMTNSNKHIYISIPLNKPISPSASSLSSSDIKAVIRQGNTYLGGSTASDFCTPDNVFLSLNNHGIDMRMEFSSPVGGTNNDAVALLVRGNILFL